MPGVLTQESFPCPPGNIPWSMLDIKGPTSYTQVSNASPTPTGGQAVSIAQLGLSVSVIWACATGSDDGQYTAHCLLSPYNDLQGSLVGIVLKWIVTATGAEVAGATNLSSRTVRILAIGR